MDLKNQKILSRHDFTNLFEGLDFLKNSFPENKLDYEETEQHLLNIYDNIFERNDYK